MRGSFGEPILSMKNFTASLKQSKQTLVALVYLAISLVVVAQAAALTYGHVQWFDTLRQVQYEFDSVELHLTGMANATISASASNPTNYNGIRVWSASYVVFVNATDENFPLQGGPDAGEFGVRTVRYETSPTTLPAMGVLNLTFTVLPHPEVVDPLRDFVANHSDRLRIFVGITMTLLSSFGFVEIPACYEFSPLQQDFTLCPGLEVPPRTRFG